MHIRAPIGNALDVGHKYRNSLNIKALFGLCKSISGKYSIFRKCYFLERKIFLCVWLHFKKYFEKYFLMFGCVLENTIENTFSTCFSHFLTFSRLPNEYIISFIPQNTNKTQKKIIKSGHFAWSRSALRAIGAVLVMSADDIGELGFGRSLLSLLSFSLSLSFSSSLALSLSLSLSLLFSKARNHLKWKWKRKWFSVVLALIFGQLEILFSLTEFEVTTKHHCFQNRTRPGGRTVKIGNRDENRFFKPKEPDFLLIPWTVKTGVGLQEPVRTVRSNPLAILIFFFLKKNNLTQFYFT